MKHIINCLLLLFFIPTIAISQVDLSKNDKTIRRFLKKVAKELKDMEKYVDYIEQYTIALENKEKPPTTPSYYLLTEFGSSELKSFKLKLQKEAIYPKDIQVYSEVLPDFDNLFIIDNIRGTRQNLHNSNIYIQSYYNKYYEYKLTNDQVNDAFTLIDNYCGQLNKLVLESERLAKKAGGIPEFIGWLVLDNKKISVLLSELRDEVKTNNKNFKIFENEFVKRYNQYQGSQHLSLKLEKGNLEILGKDIEEEIKNDFQKIEEKRQTIESQRLILNNEEIKFIADHKSFKEKERNLKELVLKYNSGFDTWKINKIKLENYKYNSCSMSNGRNDCCPESNSLINCTSSEHKVFRNNFNKNRKELISLIKKKEQNLIREKLIINQKRIELGKESKPWIVLYEAFNLRADIWETNQKEYISFKNKIENNINKNQSISNNYRAYIQQNNSDRVQLIKLPKVN